MLTDQMAYSIVFLYLIAIKVFNLFFASTNNAVIACVFLSVYVPVSLGLFTWEYISWVLDKCIFNLTKYATSKACSKIVHNISVAEDGEQCVTLGTGECDVLLTIIRNDDIVTFNISAYLRDVQLWF